MTDFRTKTMAVLIAALAAGSLGCAKMVAVEEYEAAVSERDSLVQQNADLKHEVSTLEEQVSALGSREKDLTTEISNMKGTYDELVSDLKGELDSGKVQIEQLRNGIRLSVADEILFESGSAEIDPSGRELLEKVAAQVKDATHMVEVEGHTDDKPIRNRLAEKYPTNWELGAARASAVVRLLHEQGIDGTRLHAGSRGKFEPVASNESDDGRAKNRRIEIRLTPAPATTIAEQTDDKNPTVPTNYASD